MSKLITYQHHLTHQSFGYYNLKVIIIEGLCGYQNLGTSLGDFDCNYYYYFSTL